MRALSDGLPQMPPLGGTSNATGQPQFGPAVPISDLPDISKACTSRWIGIEPEAPRFTIEELVPEGCVTLKVAAGGPHLRLAVLF